VSSVYSGNSGNVSIASTIQVTLPSDGDALNAASVNVVDQKQSDYLEAFRQMLVLGTGWPISEGFESTTFPPASPLNAWATPSPRFPTDLAWVRSTTNPIAGVASASAPVPQAINTNSSLGLTVAFASPSRVSFLFALNCNNNQGDHLDFYVDGVLTAQLTTQTSNTLVGSRFVSDPLREGAHTFDWRFVRGASASVGSEECKIDTVEIIPDETWRNDPARALFFDEGFVNNATTAIGANTLVNPPWLLATGANAGSYGPGGTAVPVAAAGVFSLSSAAVAAADWASALAHMPAGLLLAPAKTPFVEARVGLGTLTANKILEIGLGDSGAPAAGNFVGWAWDGSNGGASNWRWRGIVAGAATSVDSSVPPAASTYFRLGVSVATVRGVTGAVFTKDGKALPGPGVAPPLMATGIPTIALSTLFRVRSVTAAALVQADMDWMRFLALR